MLHVTCRNGKSSHYKRYLHGRDPSVSNDEGNIAKEDEIVSTIIGPLDFIEPTLVYRFWSTLLKNAGSSQFLLPEIDLVSADIQFWPRNHVEPDAHITFKWVGGESLTLLIEFKWHAPLSGDDQLHRQWDEYLNNRDNALHLFIAPEISEGIKAKNENDIWGDKLLLISWLQFRSTLELLIEDKSGLGRWAKCADHFLHRVGIDRFKGFGNLNIEPPQLNEIPPILFWQQRRG